MNDELGEEDRYPTIESIARRRDAEAEDVLDVQEMSYEDAREIRLTFRRMFDSGFWEYFQDFVKKRAEGRQRMLCEMCPDSMEEVVMFARVKGAIDELATLPAIIEQVYIEIDTYVSEMQKQSEETGEE